MSHGTIEIELFDTTSDTEDLKISDVLVKEGAASSSNKEEMAHVVEKPTVKQLSALKKLHMSSNGTVYVTAVESPGLFYCQLAGTEDKLATVMERLTSEYTSLAQGELSLTSVTVGDLCCAKFSEDNSWYRAVVEVKVSLDKLTVRFVDYGNKEDVHPKSIKLLKPEFLTEPVLTVQCCLAGVKPTDSQEWSEDVCIQFEEMTAGKELIVNTQSTTEPFKVKLLEGALSISDQLLEMNLAVPTVPSPASPGREKQPEYKSPSVTVGEKIDVFITSITSPGKFYCQLVDLGSSLNEGKCQGSK